MNRTVLWVSWLVAAAAAASPPDAGTPRVPLQAVVDSLVQEAARITPGTDVALSVKDLRTGEYAGSADTVPHVSPARPRCSGWPRR